MDKSQKLVLQMYEAHGPMSDYALQWRLICIEIFWPIIKLQSTRQSLLDTGLVESRDDLIRDNGEGGTVPVFALVRGGP